MATLWVHSVSASFVGIVQLPPAGTGSVSDNQSAVLTGLGYTGTISDMERKDFLTKLSLTEPQLLSHADLEMAYLGSLGKTGSLADRQHN